MRLVPRSIRLRLALWYAGALTVMVLAFSAAVYVLVRGSLMAQSEAQLDRDMSALRKMIDHDLDELPEVDEHGSVMYFQVSGGGGGKAVFESGDWRKFHIEPTPQSGASRSLGRWDSPTGHTFLLRTDTITVPAAQRRSELLPAVAPGQPLRVTVAVDQEPVERGLRTLLVALLVGVPCAAAAAVAGGYLLAGRVLSPVGTMARKAAQISADNLADRLPVEHPDDEFGRLATVFNETLSRIEDAFDRLRRFTTDASHQLRTPLAAIRSVGEVALRENGKPETYREVIGSILEEVDRLTRLVDGLLVLTRGDLSRTHLRRERVDLYALAKDVVELLRVLAEDKGQTLTVDGERGVEAEADPATLRQCLLNLLDNAIKYTPAGGKIQVVVRRDAQGAALVEVTDNGPGVRAEDQKRIFDRFYRTEGAAQTRGAGLGLAIARWAAEINHGRIQVESRAGGGSTFRVVLAGQDAARGAGAGAGASSAPTS